MFFVIKSTIISFEHERTPLEPKSASENRFSFYNTFIHNISVENKAQYRSHRKCLKNETRGNIITQSTWPSFSATFSKKFIRKKIFFFRKNFLNSCDECMKFIVWTARCKCSTSIYFRWFFHFTIQSMCPKWQ